MTNPDDEKYGHNVLHETFHALQKSHISLHPDADSWEGYKLLAGQAIRDGKENLPWWTEGSANYMAMLLYGRQPGVDPVRLTGSGLGCPWHVVSCWWR